jgi:hypothetical protein
MIFNIFCLYCKLNQTFTFQNLSSLPGTASDLMQRFMQEAGGQVGQQERHEGQGSTGRPHQILETNPLIAAAMAQIQPAALTQVST